MFSQTELDSAGIASELQLALEAARHRFGHALCLCRRQPLKLQVRLRDAKFHLAVWPNEGALHDLGCSFFRDELLDETGLSHELRLQDQRRNTPAKGRQATQDGATGRAGRLPADSAGITVEDGRRSIALSVPGQRHHDATVRPINLRSLALGMWEEADLCRWHPAWTRDWGRTRYQLDLVAKSLEVNGVALEKFLFVPRPYRENKREQLNTEWNAFVDRVNAQGKYGPHLLIAPVRSLSVPPNRPPVMHLRHLRYPLGISDAAIEFLRQDCKASLRQLQANDNHDRVTRSLEGRTAKPSYDKNNPEVIGFFLVDGSSRGGVTARAAWLMNVHPRCFIPANNPNLVMLVEALLEQGHSFERIVSDVAPMKKTSPDWLVRHVAGPDGKPVARTALDVLDRGSSPEYLQTRRILAGSLAQKGVPTWYWVPGGSWRERRVPPLPPRDEMGAPETQRILHELKANADCDYQLGFSSRFSI